MTEVTPETPMKIQEEEIKVKDGFEHLIKILDISEQNVNMMMEWMAFQGFEDILQLNRSLPLWTLLAVLWQMCHI